MDNRVCTLGVIFCYPRVSAAVTTLVDCGRTALNMMVASLSYVTEDLKV